MKLYQLILYVEIIEIKNRESYKKQPYIHTKSLLYSIVMICQWVLP